MTQQDVTLDAVCANADKLNLSPAKAGRSGLLHVGGVVCHGSSSNSSKFVSKSVVVRDVVEVFEPDDLTRVGKECHANFDKNMIAIVDICKNGNCIVSAAVPTESLDVLESPCGILGGDRHGSIGGAPPGDEVLAPRGGITASMSGRKRPDPNPKAPELPASGRRSICVPATGSSSGQARHARVSKLCHWVGDGPPIISQFRGRRSGQSSSSSASHHCLPATQRKVTEQQP